MCGEWCSRSHHLRESGVLCKIWLLLTPMQSYHLSSLFSWGDGRAREGNKAASSSSLGKNITSKKEKEITPRAHTLHRSHTIMASAPPLFSSFLPSLEREVSVCIGRDNALTKAVGWKFANSGAHALGTCSAAARFVSPRFHSDQSAPIQDQFDEKFEWISLETVRFHTGPCNQRL